MDSHCDRAPNMSMSLVATLTKLQQNMSNIGANTIQDLYTIIEKHDSTYMAGRIRSY